MLSFGIMQGRLTPSRGRGIQFFPFENWEQEFTECAKLGLDEIEWIFDYDRYEQNPLWTENGCARINEIICRTKVKVNAVCFDYFMRRPFFKYQENQRAVREENRRIFETVVNHMGLVGASFIMVPLVDNSSLKNECEKELAADFIGVLADYADSRGVEVGMETDLPPEVFRDFIETISRRNVYVSYDSGDSAKMGYDHSEEIMLLSSFIKHVHIKDRQLHGTTVALGCGNADFGKVFSGLHAINYQGSIVLQAARSEDGTEKDNIKKQIAFVKKYLEKCT